MPKELTVRDNKLKDLIYALCKARMHPQLLDEFVSRPNDPEFKRIYEYLDAIGLVSKFGTAKTDESGQPLPTDEGDLWRYYLGPFLVGLMPRQPWEGEFEEAYQELEESLFAEHAQWEALSPLINFASPIPNLTFSNGVSIRQLDRDDLDYYFGLASQRPAAPVGIFAGEVTHAITKHVFKPKAGPMPGVIEDPEFDTVISAMRLARPGAVSYSVVSVVLRAPRYGAQFPLGGRGSSWSSPGRRAWGDQYVLTTDNLPVVSRLVERLPVATSNAVIARALARLNFSYERVRAEDGLVDSWIALETLYLKRSEQAELGFRAALRLAHFMGLARPDREWIYRLTKKSYDVRSKVVHGDPTPNLIHNLSLYTREALRLTLKTCVESNTRPNLDKIDLDIVRGKPEDV